MFLSVFLKIKLHIFIFTSLFNCRRQILSEPWKQLKVSCLLECHPKFATHFRTRRTELRVPHGIQTTSGSQSQCTRWFACRHCLWEETGPASLGCFRDSRDRPGQCFCQWKGQILQQSKSRSHLWLDPLSCHRQEPSCCSAEDQFRVATLPPPSCKRRPGKNSLLNFSVVLFFLAALLKNVFSVDQN